MHENEVYRIFYYNVLEFNDTSVERGMRRSPYSNTGGARVQVEMGTDCIFTPERGEVVIFASGALPIPVAKVVVGAPFDKWGVSDAGYVTVNGQIAQNSEGKPYRLNPARTRMLKLYEREYSGTIPANTYLLLGEGANGTLDSSRLGLIHRRDIIGRVVGEQ